MTQVFLGIPTAPRGVGHLRGEQSFPDAARVALRDGQLRANLGHATSTIRGKRAAVVGEVHRAHARALAREAAADVHQARVVARGHDLRAGV